MVEPGPVPGDPAAGNERFPDGLLGLDFFAIAESTPVFVAVAFLDNRVAYVNPTGLELVGLESLDDARRLAIPDFLTAEGLKASLEVEQPHVLEHGHWRGRSTLKHQRTGEAIPVEISSFIVRDPASGEPRLLATFQRDLRDQLEIEEHLRHGDRLRAVGELAASVAHDFNNILTVILGGAELLRSRTSDPETVEELENIVGAADQASRITQQLLAISRREVTRPRPVALNRFVRDFLPMAKRLTGAEIECALELDDRDPVVLVDETHLGQVMLNLCVNARDAIDGRGRVVLRTDVVADPPSLPPGRYGSLSVRDDGRGIADDDLGRVADIFYTTKPGESGAGLGLATVTSILDGAGGRLRLESRLGEGTTATALLPLSAETGEPEAPGAGPTTPAAAHRVVLVAEDEPMVRRVVAETLRTGGYEVIAVADGVEAFAAIDAHPEIDLVVTDMAMPGHDGTEVAAKAATALPGVRILSTSGHTQSETARQAIAEGRYAFLPKPFAPSELLRLVRELSTGA